MIATVAGVAPLAFTADSTSIAHSKFAGNGMPWLMMVLSSATIGSPDSSARATSRLTYTLGDVATDKKRVKRNRGEARRSGDMEKRNMVRASLGYDIAV